MRLAGQIKTLSKETLIYGIGNAAGSIVSFLLLPLYTKFLTPADYGYLAVFAVFQSVIEITVAFGLSSGLFRYYLMAETKTEQRKVISTCFWTQLIFIIVIATVVFPLAKQFSFIFFENSNFSKYFALVSATGFLSAFGGFVFSYMRAERKPIFFAIVQLVKITLLAITNIYFVAILHKSYQGVIIGNFGVALIINLFVIIWFARFVSFSFSFQFFKKLIIFIAPIYVVNVFFFILSLSDRLFLNHFLSAKEVGLFSFGSKIGSIVTIGVITPFSTAIVPYALSIAKEEHFKRTFAKIIKYFLLVLTFFSLCIFYFSKEIVSVVSNVSYVNASGIIGPVLLSGVFYGLYYNLSIAIDIVEKTYLASIVVVTGALVSVGLNYLTIPLFGMYGSALASCVSNGVLFIFMYYFCQKNYPIRYEVGAFFKLIGVVFMYCMLYFIIETLGLILVLNIVIKIVLCIIFPFILYVLHIFDNKEREYCLSLIQKVTF